VSPRVVGSSPGPLLVGVSGALWARAGTATASNAAKMTVSKNGLLMLFLLCGT
jgi:hypothetical protein